MHRVKLQGAARLHTGGHVSPTEKYLRMNHCFIEIRDAIFEPNVEDEAEEDPNAENQIMAALGILNSYLDYYKELNGIKTREKK